VNRVAGGTLAILGRLMFHFGFGDLLLEIVVAFGANLIGRFDQKIFII